MKKITLTLAAALVAVSTLAAEVNLGACMGCHGKTFEKAALGKSKIVSDMNATEIATAMVGYKDGTYDSAGMAVLMKGQVRKYSNEELKSIAEQIVKK